MPITVQTKFGQLRKRLSNMEKRGRNLKPILEDVGDVFVSSIEYNFEVGGRHSGDPDSIFGGSLSWVPWSADYAKNKKRGGGQLLIDTGNLSGGIDRTATSDELTITSGGGGSSVYAYRQHHGGGGIPARPFMVLQEEDVDDALKMISTFLVNGKS